MIPVHTSIILDTRRALKNGSYPVKLRITFRRDRRYYGTNFSLTEEEFSKTQAEKPKGKYKEMRLAFQAIEQKAIVTIRDLNPFSFNEFDKKFLSAPVKNDIFTEFDQQIKKLLEEGRVGTANSYQSASFSLLSYIQRQPIIRSKGLTKAEALAKRENLLKKRKPLPFSAITVELLDAYEKWMVSNGSSPTTIGIYLRAVRAMYNNAIAAGVVNSELYPFGKRKYQIPAGRNPKKALTLEELSKINKYEPATESEARAKDLWLFSFLAHGINIKDIARLKYKNIDVDRITFIRAKTERTSRQNLKPITVMLTQDLRNIISLWGNKPVSPGSYVFPILTEALTPQKELAVVKQATKAINKYMRRIAVAVGIEKDVTTYSARHSYATLQRNRKIPIEYISESLGHSNVKVTESYLASFDDEAKWNYAPRLSDLDN